MEPGDYDSEEEYEEVHSEVKESEENTEITLSFSVNCPALDKLNEIEREDYPNQRRYNAAYTLTNELCVCTNGEYEQKERDCCRFILENADKIIAANYLSNNYGFLYEQAIKDNYKLPCSLPEENEKRD